MKQLKVVLTSENGMLMHSDRLVDPLSKEGRAHKALTSDRKLKATDEGKVAIAKSLYLGAFYQNHEGKIILPLLNIRKSLIEGARRYKLGKDVERAVIVMDDAELIYDGPDTPEELWEDGNFLDARTVVIGRAKVMAYRPLFREWMAEVDVIIDEELFDIEDLKRCWETAGKLMGIGDFRPFFGRYSVSIEEV